MRRYELIISNAQGQIFNTNANGGFSLSSTGTTYSSQVTAPNGGGMINNPGACNIAFDLPVYGMDTPQGKSIITVQGVGLKSIGQSSDLNGQYFKLYAGMAKGLPLANPSQYGLIAQGQIFQAFGNWELTNQTIDLICNPGVVSNGAVVGLKPPNGIALDWQPDQELGSALSTTFSQAFPGFTQLINVSDNLKPPNNAAAPGIYPSMESFGKYIMNQTKPLGQQFAGDDYPGVRIVVSGNTITAYDGTATTTPTQLAFQDFLGQPTWIGPATISFKCVLTSKIHMGDSVKFPAGITAPYALTSASAAVPGAPSRSNLSFQGTFVVTEVHHFANFRQPDGASWNTTFTAVAAPTQSSTATSTS